jgi:hypothetical protein
MPGIAFFAQKYNSDISCSAGNREPHSREWDGRLTRLFCHAG